MITRYNNLTNLFFIPGIIAQGAGSILMYENKLAEPLRILALLLSIGGTLMAVTGLTYYAKAKGRSPLWGVAGFISLLGLLLLAVLKDRSGDARNT